jgi:hypothetical protein
MARTLSFVWRELTADRRDEFAARGHRLRNFFPHTLRYLPKAGPDGYKLAVRMAGRTEPAEHWEIVLYADERMLAEFPRELFFDDDLVWHQQHFGLPGQLATADVVLAGDDLWSFAHVSDVVQRIGRRREHKTRIDTCFRGWHDMLLNGVLAFAAERGVRRVHLPRASFARRHTDRKRWSKPELYERIYDRDVNRLFRATATGDWWLVDVAANRDRIVPPTARHTSRRRDRIVCVCHDIERGLGHSDVDPDLGRRADESWRRSLAEMLDVEAGRGIRATYNVVGVLLPEVRDELAADGHCVAFHSFDHRIDEDRQLERCRELDYRLKGYRPPQSKITPELTDERLLFHNFEWFASSPHVVGAADPVLRDRLVRVPVDLDDFDLYHESLDFDSWERRALALIESRDVTVISVHDCYADGWLPRYDDFLARVSSVADLWTIDELAADVTLAAAE